MKITKLLLCLIIISFSINSFAQEEDFSSAMGASKANVLKAFSKHKRIINGEYYQLSFEIEEDVQFHFYFDQDLLCNQVLVQKNLAEYENAKLVLSGDFPNKTQNNGFLIYWNSNMMAILKKMRSSFVVSYEKFNPMVIEK